MTAVVENEQTTAVESINVYGLVPMMRDLALFCGRDKELPMLQYVQLYTEGGKLHGWATNRFVMGHAIGDPEGSLSSVSVHYKDAENIAKTFKSSENPYLIVSSDGTGAVTVSDGFQAIIFRDGNVEHPPMAKLVDEIPKESSGEPSGFAPEYMEKPVKVAKSRKEEIVLQTGPDPAKPSHWQIGDYFRALVMPRRLGDSAVNWLPNA